MGGRDLGVEVSRQRDAIAHVHSHQHNPETWRLGCGKSVKPVHAHRLHQGLGVALAGIQRQNFEQGAIVCLVGGVKESGGVLLQVRHHSALTQMGQVSDEALP